MMNKNVIAVLISFIIFLIGCAAVKPTIQASKPIDDIPAAQREFRAAWVATVDNIDWPSKPGLTTAEQKQEAIAILDTVQKLNMNAVIFQVRPQCDALYKSNLEPWSYYLTGEQGNAPEPFYDPLQFWITEAHKRGLELHAWFNPYRAHHPKGGDVSEFSIVNKKPDLVKKLEKGYYWLDPSKSGTQEHSIAVVMDVLKRYDIDGVHFDDYFYPYPSYNNGKDFPDEDSWQEYQLNGGALNRKDWRRAGVDNFIKQLYGAIKSEKRYVKFGLSPFGIYRPGHPQSVAGFDQYDVLYADARLWLNEGWVDYFTPQLYWPINRIPQSFPVLLGWWQRENKRGRNLWPGLYSSRVKDEIGVDENLNQIMITRGIVPEGPGHVHFSVKAFMDTSVTLNKSLLEGPYRNQALIPTSSWLDNNAPETPTVTLSQKNDSLYVQWIHKNIEDVFLWVIYFEIDGHWRYKILNYTQNEFKIPKIFTLTDRNPEQTRTVSVSRVALSAVDRTGNESIKKIILIN